MNRTGCGIYEAKQYLQQLINAVNHKPNHIMDGPSLKLVYDGLPDDETIEKVIWIWEHSDISTNEEINTNDYIREHWNDED